MSEETPTRIWRRAGARAEPIACKGRAVPETRLLLKHAEDPELRTLTGYKRRNGYATMERADRKSVV